MLRIEAGADADAAIENAPSVDERFAQTLLDRAGNPQEAVLAIELGHHHGEFVTAEPGNGVAMANHSAQPFGEHLEEHVAGIMAQ